MIITDLKIFLASNSPRRLGLIKEMGFEVEKINIDFDETYPENLKGAEVSKYIAEKKGKMCNINFKKNEILLTADTIVEINNEFLFKPKDQNDAVKMLQKLMNKKHKVHTGVYLKKENKEYIFSDTTEVEFGNLDQKEIEYYVKNFKPYDKSGSYGIQEWIGTVGITGINGSFNNVMGLPTEKLYFTLKKI